MIYVVTHGSFVEAASTDIADARTAGEKAALKYADAAEHEWRPGDFGVESLFYKSEHSGRWNDSKYRITPTELRGADSPRYVIRDGASDGYIVWDTHADRPASGTEYFDADQAQSHANARNEIAH